MEHQLNYRLLEWIMLYEARRRRLQNPPGASRGLQGPAWGFRGLQDFQACPGTSRTSSLGPPGFSRRLQGQDPPKPKTRNPKPKTQNPKSKTQNPKSKTQNPKPKTQNPKPQIQNPQPKTQNPNGTKISLKFKYIYIGREGLGFRI